MPPVTNVEEVVAQVDALPPLPAATQRLLVLTSLPPDRADLGEIAKVITHEPALAALALKWVNSPLYGVRVEVRNVHQAVSLMGLRVIRQMVLGFELHNRTSQGLYGYGMSAAAFSEHSLSAATACHLLAERYLPALKDEAFTLGLLHDIGMLLLDPLVKEHRNLFAAAIRGGMTQEAAERELFGIDHCALGAKILQAWNLPEDTAQQIALHHTEVDEETPPLVVLLKVADSLTEIPFAERLGHKPAVDEGACRMLGISVDGLRSLQAHLEASREGAAAIFAG
ncbi:MAG: HDOD domain-containing protein [Nitrospirae bacterium]|nr:MAG: HDOD domain-containing protein [Nitrospirota bacterium]